MRDDTAVKDGKKDGREGNWTPKLFWSIMIWRVSSAAAFIHF